MFTSRVSVCSKYMKLSSIRFIRTPVKKVTKPSPQYPHKTTSVMGNSGTDSKASSRSASELMYSLDNVHETQANTGIEYNTRNSEIRTMNDGVKKSNKKLSQGLNKTENDLSASGIGFLDSYGSHICDILNDGLLENNNFYGMIRGSKHPGDVLDISHVKVNKDCSHIMAYWNANFINKFVELVVHERGTEEGGAMRRKLSSRMSSKLQSKEPQFRSLLIKKMDFRKVPRITFQEYTAQVVKKLKQKRTKQFVF